MKKVNIIMMLSGGRDSFLSACRLLESDSRYRLKTVTYDNGCSYCSRNAKKVSDRLARKYKRNGKSRVKYLGVYKITSVIRDFFFPYFNMKPTEQAERFSGMTPSQFHCLICRTSMYIYSIWLAMLNGAAFIAEGGRKSQGFVVELPGMSKERYPALVESAGFKLLLPVYDLSDDWERDNELLARGFLCKSKEPKCLLGYPLADSVDDSVIEGVHAYYDEIILPLICKKRLLSMDNAERYIGNDYDELEL